MKQVSLIVHPLVLYMDGYACSPDRLVIIIIIINYKPSTKNNKNCGQIINQVLRIIQIAVKRDVKTGRI